MIPLFMLLSYDISSYEISGPRAIVCAGEGGRRPSTNGTARMTIPNNL